MNIALPIAVVVAVCFAAAHTFAAADGPVQEVAGDVPAGDVLIASSAEDHFMVVADDTGAVTPADVKTAAVDVTGQAFKTALRVDVPRAGNTPWAVQLQTAVNTGPVAEGDVVLLALWARCVETVDESGEGAVLTRFQGVESPWPSPVETSARLTGEWKRMIASSRSEVNLPTGSGLVTLHLARQPQVLEVGPIVAINLGPDADLASLPQMTIDYSGRAADSPWRVEAARRIEQHRKGDLAVNVVDLAGNPVPGATVRVEMTRHAFKFGSFYEIEAGNESEDAQQYRHHFDELFNAATTPIYWEDWGWVSSERRLEYVQRAHRAKQAGYWVRAHCAVWPSRRWLPTKVEQVMDDPRAVDAAIDAHFADVLTAIAPLNLDAVDLVNEPRVNHEVMDLLGDEVMAKWWKRADTLNPGPRYYLNDYGILNGGGSNSAAVGTYKRWIDTINDGGGKVEGIGFQGHFGNALTPPPLLWKILDEFADYGVPLQVTEFDTDTTDEQAQADYTRDFYTAMFAHEAVDGVFMWGFWEQIHWRPKGAMFRSDWSPKPNLQAYKDLVLDAWWTDETLTTDKAGATRVRGFLGEYRVIVETEDAIAVQPMTLERSGTAVTVTLGIE